MAKQKYILGFLILVVLTASIYFMIPGSVRIDIGNTYSTFKVWENDSWTLSGQEYTLLFDGTTKMRANERVVNYTIEGNETTAYRYAYFKEGCLARDTYVFDGSTDDVTLFPVSHEIETFNCEGFLLVYEVKKLEYFGSTDYAIGSAHEFGHNMKVEWEDGNYYERLYKYKGKDEGKLTIKYRVEDTYLKKNVRLYDPIISTDTVFTKLISNKADITGGESIFEFNNPVDNLNITDLYMSYYLAEGVPIDSAEFYIQEFKEIAVPIYEEVNVSYDCEILNNETHNKIQSTCHILENQIVNHKVEKIPEWKEIEILDKGKHLIKLETHWNVHLGPQELDWFPNLHLDKEKYILPKDKFGKIESKWLKQEKWAWYNTSFNFKQLVTINYSNSVNLSNYWVNYTWFPNESHVAEDYSDMRIVNFDENATFIWKYTNKNSTKIDFWIRTDESVGSVVNGVFQFYIYYNVTSPVSYGWNNTFFYGDTFTNQSSLDWTIGATGGGTMTLDTPSNSAYILATVDFGVLSSMYKNLPIEVSGWEDLTINFNGTWGGSCQTNDGSYYRTGVTATGADPADTWIGVFLNGKTSGFGTTNLANAWGTVSGTAQDTGDTICRKWIDGSIIQIGNSNSSSVARTQTMKWGGDLNEGEVTETTSSYQFTNSPALHWATNARFAGMSASLSWLLISQGNGTQIASSISGEIQPVSGPTVIINSPLNNTNFETTSVTINATAYDDVNLINVSYILDDVYQETNTSGLNNSNYIFTETLPEDSYEFKIEACDNENLCINETGNFTVDFIPVIVANATGPEELFTDTDYLVNLTIQDNSASIFGHVQFYVNDVGVSTPFQTAVSNNTNTLVGTLENGNFSDGNTVIAEVWASDGINTISKVNLTEKTVGTYENVSLFNSKIEIEEAIISSTTNVVLFNGTVNLTEPHHFTAKGSGGLRGTTGGTVSVSIQMDVNGITIIDEIVGSVSLASDRKQFTVTMNDTLVPNGTNIITVYGRTSVNRAVEIYSLEFFGDTDGTNSNEELRHEQNLSSYSFSNTNFENIENYTIGKNGHNSSIMLDFKTTQQASGATSVSCYFKNSANNEVSPTTTNYILGAAETRSGGFNFVTSPTLGNDTLELWCLSSGGATVDLDATIYYFDLRTGNGNFLGNFQNTTSYSGLSGSDQLLATYNYTVLNSSKVDILATVVFESTSGAQTGTSAPQIWVNSSNSSLDCFEEYERSFSASNRLGVVKFYLSCNDTVKGNSYPFNLYTTIAGGETVNILNASLSGFESEELNITNLIVTPIVAFFNPINGTTINGNDTLIVNVTDPSGVGWTSQVNLSYSNGTILETLLDEGSALNTTNLLFQSENYSDGDYIITWYAINEGGTGSDNVQFILDNTNPEISIISPLSQTYSTNLIYFEVRSNEPLSGCLYTLDEWVTNQTMTEFNSTLFNYTQTEISDGIKTSRFFCNDTLGNFNDTQSVVFEIDTIRVDLGIPLDNSFTDSVSTEFTANGSSTNIQIANMSLYNTTGGYSILGTVGFTSNNYFIDIYADSFSGTDINTVNFTEIANGVWRVNSTEADYNTSRAQVIKTLFYGTTGSNERILNFGSPTKLISNDIRDNGVNAFYFVITNNQEIEKLGTAFFTNNDSNNVTMWVYLNVVTSGDPTHSRLLSPYYTSSSVILQTLTSSIPAILNNLGTDNFNETLNPINFSLYTFAGINEQSNSRVLLLSKGTLNTSGSFTTLKYFNENHSIPSMEMYNFSIDTKNVTISQDVISQLNWTYELCNVNGICEFSNENRTVTLDLFPPIVDIIFPLNTTYFVDINDLNYSVVDNFPEQCWYSIDKGVTNSSIVSFGTNFTDVEDVFGLNNWTVYCNDTSGRVGLDQVVFTKKRIRFTGDATNTTKEVDFSDQNWIFSQVDVYPINETNTTFSLYTSEGLNATFSYTNQTREINFTNLGEGYYFFNVSVCYDNVTCFGTETREYGNGIINLTLNNQTNDLVVELNSPILVNVSTNTGIIYVDINHPDYGVNYSSSFWSTGFNLIINYFRNNLFPGDSLFSLLSFSGTESKLLGFLAHQYDEIDSVVLNITGTARNVSIINNGTLDKLFLGNLSGNYIFSDNLFSLTDGLILNESLFYITDTEETIYILVDSSADLLNITFNLTGLEYGFNYSNTFETTSEVNDLDFILTEARVGGGTITPPGNNPLFFLYDDYDSSINTTLWAFDIADGSYSTTGSPDDRYNYVLTSSEDSSKLRNQMDFTEAFSGGNGGFRSASNGISLNRSWINLWTTDNIILNLRYDFSGFEDQDTGDCDGSYQAYLGDELFWTSKSIQSCYDYQGGGIYSDCTDNANTDSQDLTFNLTRRINNSWSVEISGIEKRTGVAHSTIDSPSIPECGTFTEIYNYTSGVHTLDYTVSSVNCVEINEILTNTTYLTDLDILEQNSIYLPYTLSGIYSDSSSKGCEQIISNLDIHDVNQQLYNQTDGWAYSNSIFNSAGNVEQVGIQSLQITPTGEDYNISTYLSSDNGNNYNLATPGLTTITNPGVNVKYAFYFDVPSEGYAHKTNAVWEVLTLYTPQGFPENISIDLGSDGIIEGTINGSLNNTNSPQNFEYGNYGLSGKISALRYISDNMALFPITIFSQSVGQIDLSNLTFSYNPNPISLNSTLFQNQLSYLTNFGEINLTINATEGIVNFTDLKFDYAGGNKTYQVLAHTNDYSVNTSLNLTYYYSKWNYEWVPPSVEWIYFAPSTFNSKNVSAYGQTDLLPLLNLTNYGYGNKNTTLSIYMNDTLSCVNTTLSITENKSDGFLLNDSWLNITEMEYLETVNISLWADYECNYSNWYLFQPYIYFRQCVEDGVCSEALI